MAQIKEGAESETNKVNQAHATELERVNQAHATELERVNQVHKAELEQLKAAHKAELEREKKDCLERAEVARKWAEDNLAQVKGVYDGQVKASEEKHAAELKSSEEKYAAKEAKLAQNWGVLFNSDSKKFERLYLAKLAELNKLKAGVMNGT
jgi:acyl-CoA reductase-like NAD-dependent aldehyde dehydrogenase